MAKKGYVGSSLQGLRDLAETLSAVKKGRVDVGFFAGEAQRGPEKPTAAAARSRRVGKLIGQGSKAGYYKQGVYHANMRKKLGYTGAAYQRPPEGGDAVLTNPELAAKHEYGVGVPRRSMLRMPFHLHGDKVLKEAQADARVQLAQLQRNPRGTAKKLLDRVGIAGENLVQEAFDTRGFGSWKPNAPLTVELKGSDAPLIDSAQMRHAVDSRAVL
jgi:hypothetical protein